jgi:hypothetical protein
MNYKLNIADRDDDAAFRARLAPLASEVLPKPNLTVNREMRGPARGRTRRQKRLIVAASIAAVLVALVAVCLYFEFPWPSWQDNARAAAADASAPRTTIASAESKQKFGLQDNAGVATSGPASPAQSMASRSPPFNASDDMVVLLLQRGDTALAEGDIIAARMLYERAAALGSAAAATSAGKTYDGEFLSQAGVRGIQADQSSAMAWFRKAAALGDPEARARLAHIESRSRP